jgi:quercetin dioxygenase-like cupin family protein
MKTLPLVLLVVSVAAASSVGTVVAQKTLQKSTVYDWAPRDAKPNDWGAVRQVMRAPTPTLDELEIHITTLNPGQISHPPHQHPEEELLIVREGMVETLQNGKASRLGPGSIIFHSSNDLHNIRNVGSTPATYHVVQWRVAAAAK